RARAAAEDDRRRRRPRPPKARERRALLLAAEADRVPRHASRHRGALRHGADAGADEDGDRARRLQPQVRPALRGARRRRLGMTVWYHVRDLDAGRRFYRDTLGFVETYFDAENGWARLENGEMEI